MKPLPSLEVLESQRERFESSIGPIQINTGCRMWLGGRFESGYGYFNIQNIMFRAHRIAFKLRTGKEPGEFLVRHSCDNPACCNYRHLLLGTWQDNMNDKVARGRQTFDTGMRKLNLSQVREIRILYPSLTYAEIGNKFGITEASVGNLIRGKTYAQCK